MTNTKTNWKLSCWIFIRINMHVRKSQLKVRHQPDFDHYIDRYLNVHREQTRSKRIFRRPLVAVRLAASAGKFIYLHRPDLSPVSSCSHEQNGLANSSLQHRANMQEPNSGGSGVVPSSAGYMTSCQQRIYHCFSGQISCPLVILFIWSKNLCE